MPHTQPVAAQMVQYPSVVMQQLHAACRQAIRQLQSQTTTIEAANASKNSSKRACKLQPTQGTLYKQSTLTGSTVHQPQQHCQQQLQQLRSWHTRTAAGNGSGLQQSASQPMRLLQRFAPLPPGNCRRLYLLNNSAQHCYVQYLPAAFRPFSGHVKPFCRLYSNSSIGRMSWQHGSAAASAARRTKATSSSSGWRTWVSQQLAPSGSSSSSSSVMPWQLLQLRTAATGLTAYCTSAGNAAAAANLAAALRTAAADGSSALSARAAAIAGWCDSWALWVDKTSGLLLSSLLNALNLVGDKLPMALGLLLVDMAHNSPLLGGSRADSLQQPYLPDRIPQSGFYADGGLAAVAAADNKQRSLSDQQSISSLVQGFWSETAAAVSAGARLVWLGFIWLPAVVTAPVAFYWGVGRSWWLVLLRLSLEFSGPAFIKWGQWAATRHDLFAQDVCSALEQLHTNAPAHSFRFTCSQLKKSFDLHPKELFEWIEEVPIACGSIGQVHRARLSEKGAALTGCAAGDLVAIKARHPGVSEAIERDFQTMVWLAQLAGQLLPAARSLRLDDTLKQFAAPLHEQVDLSREASNLQRFNKNFKRTRAVSFPLPLYPLVSPDVLVESFEAGRHISHYIAAEEGSNPYRSRLAELGSGTMLQMMLVDNLIHSDLHPGNILVRLEPPGGLLGLAYKTLSNLANPEGPAMKLLAKTLDRMHTKQTSAPDQIAAEGSSDLAAARNLGLNDQQALTVSVAGSETTSSSGSLRLQCWADLRRHWCNVRAAAADPAAFLSKVQTALSDVTAGWLQPHIVLLDVGMATELTPEDQTNMVGLFRAFAALNGAEVASWVLRFSGTDQSCPEPQSFVEDMQVTFEALKKTIAAHAAAEARWKQQQQQQQQRQQQASSTPSITSSSSSDETSLESSGTGLVPMPEKFDSGAEALATVLELVRVHGVSLPGHICAVVVTTLILEGWSNKLAPEHSVLNQVKGMFSPAMYSWHDRMDSVVDLVMDRGDTALSLT